MLHASAWAAGFALAVLAYARLAERGRGRFALGLWLGVGCAHAGWALLYAPQLAGHPEWALRAGAVSVLFVPLGVLWVAPWREALAALPLGLAVARLGCLPYGCCYASAWGMLPEIAALTGLHVAARRRPDLAPAIALCGFGAVRLASLPLRAPPSPAPWLDPAWIALAWVGAGALLQKGLGSAAEAREPPARRPRPLPRALALMLGIWLLLPLAGRRSDAGSGALLAASLLGLVVVLGVRPRLAPARPPSPSAIAGGLLAGWLCAGLATAARAVFAAPAGPAPALLPDPADPLRWLALGGLAPALEEALYRERLLSALRAPLGAVGALLVSSALFALAHDLDALPFALAGGLVCGVARLGSGGLALPIALHAGWNQGVLALSG